MNEYQSLKVKKKDDSEKPPDDNLESPNEDTNESEGGVDDGEKEDKGN